MSFASFYFGKEDLPPTYYRNYYQPEDFTVQRRNLSFKGDVTSFKVIDDYAIYTIDNAVRVQTISHNLRERVATYWSDANKLCHDIFIATGTSSLALLIAAGIIGSFMTLGGIITAIIVAVIGLIALGWAIFSAIQGKIAETRCRDWLNDYTLLKAVQAIRRENERAVLEEIALNDPLRGRDSDNLIIEEKRRQLQESNDTESIQKLLYSIDVDMQFIHNR